MVIFSREIYEFDVPEVSKLFSEWGAPSRVMDYASNTGVVVRGSDGKVKGACFLYMTNSPMSILDLFVVDKSLPKDTKKEVIDMLLNDIIILAKKLGFRAIMAQPRYSKSRERLLNIGFKSSPRGVCIMEFV